jgi:hypothetical protein
MAAAGTIALSEWMSTSSSKQRVNIFTKLFTPDNVGQVRGYFDTSLFYNNEEFVINPNEQHLLLMQGSSFDQADSTVYPAKLDNDDDNEEVSINVYKESGQLCYAIKLLSPGVTLSVGKNANLSVLLMSAQLHVTTYMVTKALATRLKRPLHEKNLVRSQVETIRQSTIHPKRKRSCQKENDKYDSPRSSSPLLPSPPPSRKVRTSETDVPYRPCSPTSSFSPLHSLYNM